MEFIVRRIAALPLMLIGVTLTTFVVTHLIPADPARVAAGLNAPEEQVERLRQEMGLYDPLPVQYLRYLGRLARGDLGQSMVSRIPVAEEIAAYLPATLELLLFATIGFVTLGILFGLITGAISGRFAAFIAKLVYFAGMATPMFWLALLLQVVFYRDLGWLPAAGRLSPSLSPPSTVTGFYTVDALLSGDWPVFVSSLQHLILPAGTLAVARFGVVARFVSAEVRDALTSDYVRTARAKGVSNARLLFRHVLRNVLIPVVTISGLQMGWMLTGSVLVEAVFSWPGIGWYAWRAIVSLDFMPIMGVTLVYSVAFILINLAVDVLYGIIDPRVSSS